MSQPSVCAIMITADRPQLAEQAATALKNQTHPARLMILDTGNVPMPRRGPGAWRWEEAKGRSIGRLRNAAICEQRFLDDGQPLPDIIVHWDDDDWSHPERIARQVALLQSSGADVVGYREMLFWRENAASMEIQGGTLVRRPESEWGEAWLYSIRDPNYALGTSLCYWRRVWAERPFADTSQGEYLSFLAGRKVVSVPAFVGSERLGVQAVDTDPLMIARIHAGNTSNAYSPETMRSAKEWRRAPEFDAICRAKMEAER